MNRYFIILLTLIVFIVSGYSYAAKKDTLVTRGVTFKLFVPSHYGTLSWQKSLDALSWKVISNASTDTLKFTVDSIYYYRAAITEGTCKPYYSDTVHVLIPTSCGLLTDYDGNVYNTVIIGDKCWMKENLRTTHYRNGNAIENVTDDMIWYYLLRDAYCWYDNNTAYKSPNGAFYNWYSITDDAVLCPTGWHISTLTEWTDLINLLGGEEVAGDKLKTTTGWWHNRGGTDPTGFSAYPAGYRGWGNFTRLGGSAMWWVQSNIYEQYPRYIDMNDDNSWIVWSDVLKKDSGFSIRCIKD